MAVFFTDKKKNNNNTNKKSIDEFGKRWTVSGEGERRTERVFVSRSL